MTFNEKNRRVFPLVPTASSYAKLNEYCGELQNSKIEVLHAKGDFGRNLSVRKVVRAKRNDCEIKWGSETAISEMGGRGSKCTLTIGK